LPASSVGSLASGVIVVSLESLPRKQCDSLVPRELLMISGNVFTESTYLHFFVNLHSPTRSVSFVREQNMAGYWMQATLMLNLEYHWTGFDTCFQIIPHGCTT
jgi:hypothetical protein